MSGVLLLSAAAFLFADPAGDAHGDGGYILPTRPAYSADALDLREFRAEPGGNTMRFTVGFGGTGNPWNLPSGFSSGVTDIFIKGGLGGDNKLDDLGLRAQSGGWQYHLRVSGAGSTLERFEEGGDQATAMPAPEVRMEGTNLHIASEIPAGEYSYWVTSSVYSPLSADGVLRPSTQSTPTALQAGRPGSPAPVDVLASPTDRLAYSSGQLASVGQGRDQRPLWLTGLGAVGLLLTLLTTARLWRGG